MGSGNKIPVLCCQRVSLTRGPPALRATAACALLRSLRLGRVDAAPSVGPHRCPSRAHTPSGGLTVTSLALIGHRTSIWVLFRDITHVLCAVLLLSRFVLRVPRAGESLGHFCLDHSKNDYNVSNVILF